MRFFAKLTFICNLFFILAVILRLVENANREKALLNGAISLQPVESTLVVLGYSAIVVNFMFLLCILLVYILKREQALPRWLIWSNLFFFAAQLSYFFLPYA